MIQGIRHSGAENQIFRHNDPVDLENAWCALIRGGRSSSVSSRSIPWMAISRLLQGSAMSPSGMVR